MKKLALASMLLILSACSDLSALTGSQGTTDSTTARMHSCLLAEGNSRLQAGTLFTNGLKATAQDMVSTCTKRLALQSMGISPEAQSTAENIITQLRNFGSAQ
jgi:hypothetical protein